jgi:hypothetical protein
MKRPSRIDGHDRICCGAKAEQCEDCPMKLWERFNLADEEFKRLKADRKSHPEAIQTAWIERNEAYNNLPKLPRIALR